MAGSGLLTFTGASYFPLSFVYNPINDTIPVQGNWFYYYYTTSSTETITCTYTGTESLNIYFCVFAQGGNAGASGTISSSINQSIYNVDNGSSSGGGGGGGQVIQAQILTTTNMTSTINLFPISTSNNSSIVVGTGQTILASPGQNGTNGQELTSNNSGGGGGNGGDGGGAGGNCGVGALCYEYKTVNYYQAPAGTSGTGYNPSNIGSQFGNTPNSTPVKFADGNTGNVATAGKQDYSGNLAGFLIYYQVPPIS
jgi:hypothetical protein